MSKAGGAEPGVIAWHGLLTAPGLLALAEGVFSPDRGGVALHGRALDQSWSLNPKQP